MEKTKTLPPLYLRPAVDAMYAKIELGVKLKRIADDLGVTTSTIRTWQKKFLKSGSEVSK